MQVILGIHFQKIWTRKNNLSILISSVGMVQKFDGKVKCKMKNALSDNQRHILLVFSLFWNFQITYILQWCACCFLRNLNQKTSWNHLRNCSTRKSATPHRNSLAWSPFCPSVIPRAHYTQAQVTASQTANEGFSGSLWHFTPYLLLTSSRPRLNLSVGTMTLLLLVTLSS